MARVAVYVRAVNAIFTDIKLEEELCTVKKEPLDPNFDNWDVFPVESGEVEGNRTMESESKHADTVVAKGKKSTATKSQKVKVKVGDTKEESRTESGEQASNGNCTCSVCFVTFPSKHSYFMHTKFYLNGCYTCNECNAVFFRQRAFHYHMCKKDSTATPRSSRIICNYCKRQHPNKRMMQMHILHAHGDLVAAGETGVERTTTKVVKKVNDSDSTMMVKSEDLNRPNSGGSSKNSKSRPPSAKSNNLFDTSLKGGSDLNSSTPSKKLRQTTLTDFISLHRVQSKNKCETPDKVTAMESTIVTSTPNGLCESPKISKFLEYPSFSDHTQDHKPFVQIHVNPNTMMDLLNKEVTSEPESFVASLRDTSYNLRPGRVTCYSLRQYNSLVSELSELQAESRKRKRGDDTPKRNKKPQLLDSELWAKFKCKECTVHLARCDQIKQEPAANLSRTRSLSRELLLAKFFEFENTIARKLMQSDEEEDLPKDGTAVVQEKVYRCHFCKKTFPLKKERREHTERFHSIYISSICNARYSSMKKLLNHYLRQHIMFNRRRCCVCYERFGKPELLKRHMVLHCARTTRSRKDTLPIDAETRCIVSKKQYKCQACRKRFWLNSCLKEHEKVCSLMRDQKEKQLGEVDKREEKVNMQPNTVDDMQPNEADMQPNEVDMPSNTVDTQSNEADMQPNEMDMPSNTVDTQPNEADMQPNEMGMWSNTVDTQSNEAYMQPNGMDMPSNTVDTQPNEADMQPNEMDMPSNTVDTQPNEADMQPNVMDMPSNTVDTQPNEADMQPNEVNMQADTASKQSSEENEEPNEMLTPRTKSTRQRVPKKDQMSFVKREVPRRAASLYCNSNVSLYSPPTANRRLINGLARVKGYQVDMTGKSMFPCTICGKRFQTFQNLCIHEGTFCKPATSFCGVCGTAFPTKRLLHVHMLSTHTSVCADRFKFFCKFCNQGFHKGTNLRVHERHFHANHVSKLVINSMYLQHISPVCTVCNLIFHSYERFIEHNMFYYDGQMFICSVCEKSFKGLYNLLRHNKLQHSRAHLQESPVYECSVCTESFNYESHFHAHKLHAHSLSITVPNQSNTLQDHNYALTLNNVAASEESSETSLKKYTCNVCLLNCLSEMDLEVHEVEYSTEGDFACDKCDRKCRTNYMLAKHYILNHIGSSLHKSFKCRYCGEAQMTTMAMQCHVRHFHENGANHASNKVNYKCTKLSDICCRLDTESDNGIYSCLTCGLKFGEKMKLKNHLLEYSDIGEYGCTMCLRKFTEISHLEVHKIEHYAGNSTFHRCSICNLSFLNRSNARMHVLHLHRYETFSFRVNSSVDVPKAVQSKPAPATAKKNVPIKAAVQCPECHLTFNSKKNLLKHRSRILNSGDHKCTICGRRFNWLTALERHIRKHNSKNRFLRYSCAHCTERFRSPVTLYSHIVHIHGKHLVASLNIGSDKPDNGRNTDSVNTEAVEASDMSASDASSEAEDTCNSVDAMDAIDVVDAIEVMAVDGSSDDLYYTCVICNMKYLTVKKFCEHFIQKHKKEGNARRETSAQTGSTKDTSDFVYDFVQDKEEKFDADILKVLETCSKSPGGMNDLKKADDTIRQDDIEIIEIIWDKRSDSNGCLTIDENVEASDIHVVHEDLSTLKQLGDNLLPKNTSSVNRDVGTLKVKSFARI